MPEHKVGDRVKVTYYYPEGTIVAVHREGIVTVRFDTRVEFGKLGRKQRWMQRRSDGSLFADEYVGKIEEQTNALTNLLRMVEE